jgi:transcription elongation factor Elf1
VSFEEEVRECFPVCPLCGNESLRIKIAKSFGKDTMTCTNCGAKWHLYCSSGVFSGFKRAELEVEADDGIGKELIQRRILNNQWEKMAREARNRQKASQQSPSAPSIVKEKETIIKEIVMIPCKYCGALMPQTAIFCSNCGAKRTA